MIIEKYNISLSGYDLLGPAGADGIRYAWNYRHNDSLVESAAFSKHNKQSADNICGYTVSVSAGCVLNALKQNCRFCRTGTLLPFSGFLTSFDIAKQNVFMVLSDIYCDNHMLKNNAREFAYMGQGEPGYSYDQVRLAIRLTDCAMNEIGQTVYRHIIATSGIPEMILAYKHDVKQHFFDSRVTMHFSLHGTANREQIMPIEATYSYKSILDTMWDIKEITGEKPCLGILMFKHFNPVGETINYSNDLNTMREILAEIDPERFRLSFCEYNDINDISSSDVYPEDDCRHLLDMAKSMGFEAKLFSSFGKEEVTACGLLAGKIPLYKITEKRIKLESDAEQLVLQAYHTIAKEI